MPPADRVELERRARDRGAPAREVERARIVLPAVEGVPGKEIAAQVGCAEPTVVLWRRRYAERGLAGLVDAPRPGKPPSVPEAVRDRVSCTTHPAAVNCASMSARARCSAASATSDAMSRQTLLMASVTESTSGRRLRWRDSPRRPRCVSEDGRPRG